MDETAKGPTAGELVLFCRHADVLPDQIRLIRRFHWYCLNDSEVTHPDGTTFQVSWLAMCDDCNRLAGDDPKTAFGFAGPFSDARFRPSWIGDAPIAAEGEAD